MSEKLISLGLDVGTTSTQMVLSELVIENQAGSFAVPQMEIQERKILHKSPVYFTPLVRGELVDGEKIREIVDKEYEKAGISKAQVDTGAIIITGETSRKENARSVLDALSRYAGDFVVATAGPDLESTLAAKGAGAVDYSARTGKKVLHMDIGGGTSNLALIENGKIIATTCLNVGGRLLKMDAGGRILYVSPVLEGLFSEKAGEVADRGEIEKLAEKLTEALEMAAGLREKTPLLDKIRTNEAEGIWPDVPEGTVMSFSGGVADCIGQEKAWLSYGDLGVLLGRAIWESALCRGQYRLGEETIRATVIGAGCHSAQLSGSTVYAQNVEFPLKNLPVTAVAPHLQTRVETLRAALAAQEMPGVLALPGWESPTYHQVEQLADAIAQAVGEGACRVALRFDMAKALGAALALRLGTKREILCLDRLILPPDSYLDVGSPIGPALPVVIKTLVLETNHQRRSL